jgi:hypothetical protein
MPEKYFAPSAIRNPFTGPARIAAFVVLSAVACGRNAGTGANGGAGGDSNSGGSGADGNATNGGAGGSTTAGRGGSDGVAGEDTDDAGTSGGAGNGGNAAGSDPAFLLGTRVWDDVTTTSYFHVVSSLDAETEVDPSQALEVPGAAKLYSVPSLGWFAIGGGEEPTITRYTLGENRRLIRGDSISLQPYGVASLWDTLYIVSPTKAYYPDRDGAQLIIWNPTAMKVTGSIALPDTVREGHLALYGYAPIVRDGELLISVGWFDWNESDSVLGETGLVRIDTQTDEVIDFEVDERCGGITTPISVPSGDTYLASSALAGAAHRLDRLATEPCALRILAAETAFDPDYLEGLDVLTGADIVGEPIPAGGNSVFLRVFDDSLGVVPEDGATWEITSQIAWNWVRWDVTTNDITPIDALGPSTSDVLWFQVDGRVYGTETTADYSETTLIDLTAAGGPKRALTAPGFLHGVARVQ